MPSALKRNLPNALTILRLVLAAAFFGALNAYRYPDDDVAWANVAIALFILAAITDAFDGALARRWGVVSVFGRIMDPFCDKVLVLGAFIYMAGPRFVVSEWLEPEDAFFTMATGVYPWMVALILARELLVTGVRGVMESMNVNFGSMLSGKLKMILQSIAVPVVLFLTVNLRTHETEWARHVCNVLIYITVAVTVWSGIPYITGLRAVLRKGPERGVFLLNIPRALVTVFGLGHCRPASGTWGSMPAAALALGMALVIGPHWTIDGALVATGLLFSIACVRFGHLAEEWFGRKDPGQVVADEMAGQCVALLLLPWREDAFLYNAALAATAFLTFRIFDIFKPPPANGLQRIPGGWGILVDDLVAGLYALIVTQLAARYGWVEVFGAG